MISYENASDEKMTTDLPEEDNELWTWCGLCTNNVFFKILCLLFA